VLLDFGSEAFDGHRRWLETAFRPGDGTGEFTPIVGPRAELTPVPHALLARKVPWAGVTDKPEGFADDTDDDALGGIACGDGQVPRWNGLAWYCSSGIQRIVAGSGLLGGGDLPSVTLSLALGGSGAASTAARSDHNHLGQTWTGSAGLTIDASATGGAFGFRGTTASTNGRGVIAISTAATGNAYGLQAESRSSGGGGIIARSTAINGSTFGVDSSTASRAGIGVRGVASATTGDTAGVLGVSRSSSGVGVRGSMGSSSRGVPQPRPRASSARAS
jgi:hypothetical protein